VAPNVIVGASTPVVGELRRLTSTIPLVFTQVGDPIDSGLVTNLAQPGGNITGFSAFEPDMGGKWLGVVKEAAPRRGRRVSQLSETLAASVAKKRERLVQVKGLTRYGKRHPRIQPKNTPRGPLKNGSKNRTQVPVPARARVYGSDPRGVCQTPSAFKAEYLHRPATRRPRPARRAAARRFPTGAQQTRASGPLLLGPASGSVAVAAVAVAAAGHLGRLADFALVDRTSLLLRLHRKAP